MDQWAKARSTDLRAGDEVTMGRYVLVLVEGEPKVAAPVSGPADVAPLQKLVEFSRTLMSGADRDTTFRLLLEAVVDITGAEKGF